MLRKETSTLKQLDEAFPRKFKRASGRAYREALNAGIPVTVAINGVLWRVEKKGDKIHKTKVKDLPPRIHVDRSVKLTFR